MVPLGNAMMPFVVFFHLGSIYSLIAERGQQNDCQ
jgi:hypothetical protein